METGREHGPLTSDEVGDIHRNLIAKGELSERGMSAIAEQALVRDDLDLFEDIIRRLQRSEDTLGMRLAQGLENARDVMIMEDFDRGAEQGPCSI